MGISMVAGDTDAQARDKLADYLRHASPEAGLAHFAAGSGVDFSRYGLDDEISYCTSNGIQSTTQVAKSRGFTKRQLLD